MKKKIIIKFDQYVTDFSASKNSIEQKQERMECYVRLVITYIKAICGL